MQLGGARGCWCAGEGGELQLRLDEVAACERRLAEQQERWPQVEKACVAWHEYKKALLKAEELEEKLRESDGSSSDCDPDSDSDSDEQLTLDELHVDADASAEPP